MRWIWLSRLLAWLPMGSSLVLFLIWASHPAAYPDLLLLGYILVLAGAGLYIAGSLISFVIAWKNQTLHKAAIRSLFWNLSNIPLSIALVWAALQLMEWDRFTIYNEGTDDWKEVHINGAEIIAGAVPESLPAGKRCWVVLKVHNKTLYPQFYYHRADSNYVKLLEMPYPHGGNVVSFHFQ